jgi:hypothetical protein
MTAVVLVVIFIIMSLSASLLIAATMLSSRISQSEEFSERAIDYYDDKDLEILREFSREPARFQKSSVSSRAITR